VVTQKWRLKAGQTIRKTNAQSIQFLGLHVCEGQLPRRLMSQSTKTLNRQLRLTFTLNCAMMFWKTIKEFNPIILEKQKGELWFAGYVRRHPRG
jgi:hypothetical protein